MDAYNESDAVGAPLDFDPGERFREWIVSVPPMSVDEERELVAAWQGGSKEAFDTLVHRLSRTVLWLAREFGGQRDIDDAFQAGIVGLLTAMGKYDPSYGTRIMQFARKGVKGAVMRDGYHELRQNTAMSVPRQQALARARRIERALAQTLGRVPTLAEVAGALDCSEKRLGALRNDSAMPLPIDGDEETCLQAEALVDPDATDPERAVVDADMRADVHRALGRLTAVQRRALTLYFGLDGGKELNAPEIIRLSGGGSPWAAAQRGLKNLQRLLWEYGHRQVTYQQGVTRWE